MDGGLPIFVQVLALLLGGGAVSGGTAWVHKRVGPSTASQNGTAEAIRNLRDAVNGLRDDFRTHRDKLDADQERYAIERAKLRERIALLEQKVGP